MFKTVVHANKIIDTNVGVDVHITRLQAKRQLNTEMARTHTTTLNFSDCCRHFVVKCSICLVISDT